MGWMVLLRSTDGLRIMNSEIKMSVSSLTRNNDKKGVYVLFTDGEKSAEFSISCEEGGHSIKIINKKGFDEDELKQLQDYIENEQDAIFSMAKTVNPLKALMGE